MSSIARMIRQECNELIPFLADEPVSIAAAACVATVAEISPHPVVCGVVYIRFASPVRVAGAFGKESAVIGTLRSVADVVQRTDVRVGDTICLGLDSSQRVGVGCVDLIRRPADAKAYIYPSEHQLPPVNLADYD